MKQHIAIEQLNELSIKAKRKLLSRTFGINFVTNLIYIKHPLLTIGQMIEFLDEYFSRKQYDFDIRIHSAGNGWKYPGQRLTDLNPPILYEIEDEVELCDALWLAVKDVLEEK